MPQPDRLLYAADRDSVGPLAVRAAGRDCDIHRDGGVRGLGDACLHGIGRGARQLWGRAPGAHHVCLLLDLRALFYACGFLIEQHFVRRELTGAEID